jgi:hypothetical protein
VGPLDAVRAVPARFQRIELLLHIIEGDERFYGGSLGGVVRGEPSPLPRIERLLLDLDNGPENHSRRSQFVYRLVQLAQKEQLTIELAYYPPYHSKYNPIERCWGVLEVYWRGELLDSEAAVLGFARSMTYGGKHPQASRIDQTYACGVCRSTKEMKRLEQCLQRHPGLEKWSVTIPPPKLDELFPSARQLVRDKRKNT